MQMQRIWKLKIDAKILINFFLSLNWLQLLPVFFKLGIKEI